MKNSLKLKFLEVSNIQSIRRKLTYKPAFYCHCNKENKDHGIIKK